MSNLQEFLTSDSEEAEGHGQSEGCAAYRFSKLKEELNNITENPRMMLEQKFESSVTALRKHVKFAGYQVLMLLRTTPEHRAIPWYDMMLTLAEKISYLEDSEGVLPLHPDGARTTYIDVGGVTKSRNEAEAFWNIRETRKDWKSRERIYHAEVAFLQREAAEPYYKLDIAKECEDLCARRRYDLERQVRTLKDWQENGVSANNCSIQFYRATEELREINPERLLSRVMTGTPLLPGELVTQVNWEKIPKNKWVKRPQPDQIMELLVSTAGIETLEEHNEDPRTIEEHVKWTQQWERHEQRLRALTANAKQLEKSGDLQYRAALRAQKRSAELREEAAVLKEWLAEGHLQPIYAFRFVEIQSDLLKMTRENILKQIKPPEKKQKRSDQAAENNS
jgi:hypothetical protein